MVMDNGNVILGAGMTGLAAGFSSGLPVFEATDNPGGICSSYYMQPGQTSRHSNPPKDNSAYRFEIGGGHWIFGGDPKLTQYLSRFVSLKRYTRRSSVYFHKEKSFVPYPLQNHLRFLDRDTVAKAINEMSRPTGSFRTMKDWLESSFGPTLCNLFFYPFHDLYTAGLYERIAPQDAYKSPVDLPTVIQGALNNTPPVGYNSTFLYPRQGLNRLAQELAAHCNIQYSKEVVGIDPRRKEVTFADGDKINYDQLISTLPLNKVVSLVSFTEKEETSPYSSVLVLNIGARRGPKCPKDHWLYTPDSISEFHRVGFYSNVDRSFLPSPAKKSNEKVSIYVERAFPGSSKPSKKTIKKFADNVVAELQEWKFIKAVEVIDPTWIEVAYTWSYPESNWDKWAIETLEKHGIYQVGRYGLWRFHGIADSIRDGLYVGSTMKPFLKNNPAAK
jgi:protoporphyrinogen oxidase